MTSSRVDTTVLDQAAGRMSRRADEMAAVAPCVARALGDIGRSGGSAAVAHEAGWAASRWARSLGAVAGSTAALAVALSAAAGSYDGTELSVTSAMGSLT